MSTARPSGHAGDVRPMPRHGIDRWELLQLVIDLRKTFNLTDRDIGVLRAHLTVLPHGPLDLAGINISFMEVSEILNRACGMEERRFRRGETRLEQAGLVARHLSGNGRRFPERDGEGRIVSAYGIDLAPLLSRVAELEEMRRDMRERQLEVRRLKNAVSARLQALVRRGLAACGALTDRLEALRAEVRRVVRRETATRAELEDLDRCIATLEADAGGDHVAQPCPSGPQETAVCPDRTPADAGQSVRHIESPPKEDNRPPRRDQPQAPSPLDADRVIRAWQSSPNISEFYPDPPRTPERMARVIIEFSGFLGLGQTTVLRALSVLGLDGAIHAVDYLASRVGQVTRPEGYLKTMLACYERGEAIAGGRVAPAR